MNREDNELETLARQILVNNDMLKLPVNLATIANNNNIDVYEVEMPDEISGSIRYNSKLNRFEILLNKKENSRRKRFTLAHELSHFFLHGATLKENKEIIYDSTLYRKNTAKYREKNVDYLAGALLMDKEILTRLYKINENLETLASIFKVSVSALTVRIFILGL